MNEVRGMLVMIVRSHLFVSLLTYSSSLIVRLQRSGASAGNMPPPAQESYHARDMPSDTFERFFRQAEPGITTYLLRVTGDRESASDLSQETFLRAWQHFPELQHHPNPHAWLFRVATNLALQLRRRQRHPVGSAIPLGPHTDPAGSDPGSHWIEHALIQQVLDELPLKQRALLLLREVHGFTCAETGELLGMTLDATKMALYRARLQFREHYLRKGGVTV